MYSKKINCSGIRKMSTFLYICCIACIPAENCDPTTKPPNWEVYDFEPPSYLRLGLVPEVESALEAQIDNRKENFTITLFANPFIKDGNCPPANTSYHNLRRFHKPREVIKGDNENESIFFGKIFTGCYYVEMKDTEGKLWLWDPLFFNTSYQYHDTMLKCKKYKVPSKKNIPTSKLEIELEIPLTCLQVRIQLFELSRIPVKLVGDWISGNTQVSQDCWVKNIGNGQPPEIKCTRLDTSIALDATPAIENNENEGWSTVIKWDFSKKVDTSHYVSFKLYNEVCNMSYSDLMTWKPVVNFGSILVGASNDTNDAMYAYYSLDNS